MLACFWCHSELGLNFQSENHRRLRQQLGNLMQVSLGTRDILLICQGKLNASFHILLLLRAPHQLSGLGQVRSIVVLQLDAQAVLGKLLIINQQSSSAHLQ